MSSKHSYAEIASAMMHLLDLVKQCQLKQYEQAEKLAAAFNNIATPLGVEGVGKALKAYSGEWDE